MEQNYVVCYCAGIISLIHVVCVFEPEPGACDCWEDSADAPGSSKQKLGKKNSVQYHYGCLNLVSLVVSEIKSEVVQLCSVIELSVFQNGASLDEDVLQFERISLPIGGSSV